MPVDRIERLLAQYRTRHRDSTAGHAHERPVAGHEFELGYSWTKRVPQGAGPVKRGAEALGAPQEAATPAAAGHAAVPGRAAARPAAARAGQPPLDLTVTPGDATGEIYAAFLVEEEGTFSSFRGPGGVIARHGLFCPLYTDRGSHYFFTPEAGGGKVAKDRPTEIGRALKQLGIAHIPPYSPEARGRTGRVFGTLRQRRPQELRLAGITAVEAADRFLAERLIPEHDRRFAAAAAEPGSALVPFAGSLAEIPCGQAERVVGHGNRVRHAGLSPQIPGAGAPAGQHHFVKATVRACMNTPTAAAPSSTARAARPAMTPTDASVPSSKPGQPPGPARRRAPRICGRRCRVAHNPTGPTAAADISWATNGGHLHVLSTRLASAL